MNYKEIDEFYGEFLKSDFSKELKGKLKKYQKMQKHIGVLLVMSFFL